MNAFFVTGIIGLRVKADLGRGLNIEASTFITNNFEEIKNEFDHGSINLIGDMEFHSIQNANTIIYSKETIPENLSPEQFLVAKLYKIGHFFTSLWMLQDNCVNNEMGFLLYSANGKNTVSSNFIAVINSTSIGKTRSILSITKAELKSVINFYKTNTIVEIAYELPTTQLIKGHNRISRAYYIIQAARSQSDIAIKISNYCTAFETLFSTSSTELTHKLSERVAFFLSDDSSERISTFQFMKKAYIIRSKIVHGDVITDKILDDLKQAAQSCDDLLRRSMISIVQSQRLFDIFCCSNKEIDDFFIDLIFGKYKISEYHKEKQITILGY